MRNTHSFKMNLPEMSDPVDVRELNDNFLAIDDALMAGLCKKELTTNNMGSSDPASRKYGWAPWIEIYNGNEFDVVVIDRNAPDLPSGTINIEAGKTHRMFINGTYYMNFYVQDQHDVTFKWFTNAETRINEIEPSGGGGVSSVNVIGASGSHIESSGGPVTDTGTIELNISTGYSIPTDNKQTTWDSKATDLKLEINSSTFVITAQLKDASGNLIGNERTIDLPLESVVVSGDYDEQTKKVILTLQNGSTIEFSVADLVSGLQTELNDTDNKLDPTYIAYDASHRAVSDTEKSTWNGKQNAISDLETIRSGAAAGASAVQPTTMSEALALKQDSLSETQLAAVNSGIDSAKVAQIETNKTNILSVERMNGGKNLCPNNATSTGIFTVNKDRTVIANGSSGASSQNLVLGVFTLKAGNTYRMHSSNTANGSTYFMGLAKNTIPIYTEFGSPTFTPEEDVVVQAYLRVQANQTVNNVKFEPMVCLEIDWQASQQYIPHALPNYVLTALEAEDRSNILLIQGDYENIKQHIQYDERRLFVQGTTPTGDIPVGSTWINGKVIKEMGRTAQMIDDSQLMQGGYSTSDGSYIENVARVCTVKIPIISGEAYTITPANQKLASVVFFNGNTFVSGNVLDRATDFTFTADNNVDSVIITYKPLNDSQSTLTPTDIYHPMMNQGSSALPYSPYYDWV